jgi:hypothetical protein
MAAGKERDREKEREREREKNKSKINHPRICPQWSTTFN